MGLKKLARPAARAAWQRYSRGFKRRAARYLKRERFDRPLDFPIPTVADPRFAAAMHTYAGHGYREWVYDLGESCYLEPIRGFVLSRRGEWLVDSFLYHHRVEQTPYQGRAIQPGIGQSLTQMTLDARLDGRRRLSW